MSMLKLIKYIYGRLKNIKNNILLGEENKANLQKNQMELSEIKKSKYRCDTVEEKIIEMKNTAKEVTLDQQESKVDGKYKL